ncbi:acetolactate synthase [Thalassobaculum fulvum]|uniref:Acetolactate synthase n=1 Tax=Thalassobaculum fulvum TaxID=1633335 RepID=A0A919CR34_9PROT|nr:thiamine pyrophosphate-binding protein [Thalassobaculum fulvum]GHD55798.1 acetolactate synthase [Thalassobaculum fulvum]
MATVSEVIAGYLDAAEIGHVFGYPGDPSVEVIEAFRQAGIRFVLGRREGTAGLMALAYSQVTGRPGVALSTLGPGSSNLTNAVATALLDRVPLIAISGQIETRREAVFTHQVLDHARMFGPISKWTAELRASAAGATLRRAFRTATAERPGPVHLTTPADVVGAEAGDAAIALPPLRPAATAVQVFADPGVVADPLKRLAAARRPVIVAGIGALRAGATAPLVRLAEAAGIPVVTSPMAKGLMPEDHPYFASVLDMACNDVVWDFLKGADLIVCAGFDAVELIKSWTPKAPVVHIDAIPNIDQVYPAEVEVVGDVAAILASLADGWQGEPRWREAEVAEHRETLSKAYYEGRVAGALNPTDVIDQVRAAMPAESRATADVGSHKLLVGQGWRTSVPGGVLMTNGLSSMGYSLPGAITAALVEPERPCVCFTGDGGLAMVQSELALGAELKTAPLVVVFCDDSLNRIELKQMRRQYPAEGTRMMPVDVARAAEAMNCHALAADSPASLDAALAQSRPTDRPTVIAARIDPQQYAAQF